MKSISVIVLLLLSIIAGINSKKIGELAENNEVFRYILLLFMVFLMVFVVVTLVNIILD